MVEPLEALRRVEELTIQVDRRRAWGPCRVPLLGGVPVYKFSLGNTEGDLPFPGFALNSKKDCLK